MFRCIVLFILLWGNMFTSPELPTVDIKSNQLIIDYGKLAGKQGLHLAGLGGSIDHKTGKIKNFVAPFGVDHMMTVAEARIRFVTLVEDFIKFANKREDIRGHVSSYPITFKHLSLSIVCELSNPGEIAYVFSSGNYLCYYQRVDDSRFSQEIHEETYEEAKAIVESEGTMHLYDVPPKAKKVGRHGLFRWFKRKEED